MAKKVTLLVLAAFALTASVPAAEFTLQLKKLSGPEAMQLPGGYGAGDSLKTSKPDQVKKEPKAASDHPLYGLLSLGGERPVAFRLDESAGTGKGYDRVIVDLNGNGDLGDDPAGKPTEEVRPPSGGSEQAILGPIVPASGQKGEWEPSLYVQAMVYNRRAISSRGRDYIGYLRAKSGAYLETTVEIDGQKQKIGIADANCNLQLGDESKLAMRKSRGQDYWSLQTGDAILRDHDGSGKFENDMFSNEADQFAPVLFFGAKPYRLTLAEDRSAVQIGPFSGPTGELVVNNSEAMKSLTVGWEKAPGDWAVLGIHRAGQRVKVPAGSYGVYSCVVAGKDESGATISGSAYNRRPSKLVKVMPDQSATLACGPPLEMRVEAKKRSSSSGGGILGALSSSVASTSQVDINVEVVGVGDETYGLSSFTKIDKNGRQSRPEPPRFKILDESGKELAAGQLEYG